jgi:hypothetical protein
VGYYSMQAIYDGEAPEGSGEWQWKFMATTPLWDTQDPAVGYSFLEHASRSPGCLLAWLEGAADNLAWFGESPWDLLAGCWQQRDLVGFLNVLGPQLSSWALWCAPHLLEEPWPVHPAATLSSTPTRRQLIAFARAAARALRSSATPADHAALNPSLHEWPGPRLPRTLQEGLQQLGFVPSGEFWARERCQPLFFPEEREEPGAPDPCRAPGATPTISRRTPP